MQTQTGALVAEVQKDSPAAASGIQPGDVITKVGTQAVKDPRSLAQIVADIHSGTEENVTLRRDGQDKTISVKVEALQDGGNGEQAIASAEHGAKLGLALAPLDDQARQEMNLDANQKGVVVAGVKPDSPAQAAGLQSGDVLETVGGKAVTSPRQAVSMLHEATQKPGDAVALRVLRDGHQAFVALSAPSAKEG